MTIRRCQFAKEIVRNRDRALCPVSDHSRKRRNLPHRLNEGTGRYARSADPMPSYDIRYGQPQRRDRALCPVRAPVPTDVVPPSLPQRRDRALCPVSGVSLTCGATTSASTKGPGVMPGQFDGLRYAIAKSVASTKGPGVMPGQTLVLMLSSEGVLPQRRDRALCPVRAAPRLPLRLACRLNEGTGRYARSVATSLPSSESISPQRRDRALCPVSVMARVVPSVTTMPQRRDRALCPVSTQRRAWVASYEVPQRRDRALCPVRAARPSA